MVPLSVLGLALPWALLSEIVDVGPAVWQVCTVALSVIFFVAVLCYPAQPCFFVACGFPAVEFGHHHHHRLVDAC